MKRCPHCATNIPILALRCPNCISDLGGGSSGSGSGNGDALSLILFGLFILLACIFK